MMMHFCDTYLLVFAPIGGFQEVSKAFENLAIECGVEVMYDKSVITISSEGVWYQDEYGIHDFMAADLVVCNADLPFATETLFTRRQSESKDLQEPRYDWDDSYEFSSGMLLFISYLECILVLYDDIYSNR